jgi:glycosyltransferase involved in cell wall biosynthesis
VSHRPLDYGGGGSARWRYMRAALPERGWEVEFVTARANPTANEASTDPREARLAERRARIMNGIGRRIRPIYNRAGIQPEAFPPNALWSFTGRRPIRRAIARVQPHVVWATGPPPAAMFAAIPEARRAGVPGVAEFRDLWAGNPYFDAGGSLLRRIEAPTLDAAAAVVTVTPGCVDALRGLHPELAERLHLLPNGFDPKLLERRSPPPRRAPGERAVLVHAGTLYADRTAVALLRALTEPDLRDRVRLELIGPIDEQTAAALRGFAAGLDVATIPPLAWEEAIARTAAADVAVAINSPGTGGDMALPGKLFEALAVGRPILALTPPGSDTERVLTQLGAGAGCVAGDDPSAIAAALRGLLDDPPAAVPIDRLTPWSRSQVADQTAALLDELVRRP